MHFFTSVTANYIPKARVLAKSLKQHHPDAVFHLLLSDEKPEWMGELSSSEPFDFIIKAEDLDIPNFKQWVFKHALVELCTAVKGFGFQYIINKHNAEKVIYLDPDMVVFNSLQPLDDYLNDFEILLTPHLTAPEVTPEGVLDNEISCLKHGAFNLGFLAIRAKGQGLSFVNWWANRLSVHCYDDIPGGLFTDQKWVDLAPCFFDRIKILHEPDYNVATWNISHRKVGGNITSGLTVNNNLLRIYHFSGFDSGAQLAMLAKYGEKNKTLLEMRDWYIDKCEMNGQSKYGKQPSIYANFDNGIPITKNQRTLYRSRNDLLNHFIDPYSTSDINKSYYNWYLAHSSDQSIENLESIEVLRADLYKYRSELELMKSSRLWKITRKIATFAKKLNLN